MLKKITPNMMVKDVNKTLDYYCDILGFDLVIGIIEGAQDIVTNRQESRPLAFAIVKSDNVELMFQSEKSLTEEIPHFKGAKIDSTSVLYIEVEDIEKAYEDFKDKVTIVKDIETKFYGKREFYFCDCNGYVLGLAGDI
ncbi:MAG: VOC family protein [Planctomycetota bacterium]